MRLVLTFLTAFSALVATTTACLIASFEYLPPPAGSARAKPHLIGNLTSVYHPEYPNPICWLSKTKLTAPNDMYPLYCKDSNIQSYIWFQEMGAEGDGRGREEVFGKTQNIGYTETHLDGGHHVDFRLDRSPGNENWVGAWNYDCSVQDALW